MTGLLADCVETRVTGEIDAAVRDGCGADDGFGLRFSAELILIENLASSCRRLEDVELPILSANGQLAVGQHRRSFLDRAEVLYPELLASVHVERGKVCAVVDLIQTIAIEHR